MLNHAQINKLTSVVIITGDMHVEIRKINKLMRERYLRNNQQGQIRTKFIKAAEPHQET